MRPVAPQLAESAFEKVVAALHHAGCRFTMRKPHRVRAHCPSHQDRRASLVVSRGDDNCALLHCFGGCPPSRVLHAIGLRMCDLFPLGQHTPRSPAIVATYDYSDDRGVLLAQKVRRRPKRFSWRRPDPERPGRWISNLEGVIVGLYRLPDDLVGAPRVFLVEGEKAVERLLAEHLVATCPPNGASTWNDSWSIELWRRGCRELIVLPDADGPGRALAERVAQATWDLDVTGADHIRVKVVSLPGLSGGDDAFDWFEEGGTCDGLLKAVSEAAWWVPGGAERARRERKRLKTRDRVRRFRERERAGRVKDPAA